MDSSVQTSDSRGQPPSQASTGHVRLARTLGPESMIFMGISSLIGGGIFTLLAPAIGIVGPGLFIAMLLGSGVAFLNLQMYLALGTTFPEAGGGYLWVRKGLGDFQGFLAGWFSWFAHAAACGVYSLSFGYYAFELLRYAGADGWGLDPDVVRKSITVLMILFFGFLNWRGTKLMGRAGVFIGSFLLAILVAFVGFGLFRMGQMAAPLANFSPLLPNGILGIFGAVSIFYIAFEGSEIQVQAGEEARNPARDIKVSLLVAWGIVCLLYFFISIVIIGATTADGPVWQALAGYGDSAIIQAAASFMPFGRMLMIIAGFLANLAALNDTIFSSSHVSFAMARDSNIWARLARIHRRNFTPDLAVITSVALIIIMVLTLPLFDVASAASLLFVLLFLQLNLAGIRIHYRYPDTKWKHRVPFFPWTPVLAVCIYAVLALTMLRVNAVAWMVTVIWLLIGLVDYFAYAAAKGRERFQSEIVYQESVRLGPKTGTRVLLPLGHNLTNEEVRLRTELSLTLATELGGEIVAVRIREVPPPLQLMDGATPTHDRQAFDSVRDSVEKFAADTPGTNRDVSLHCLSLVARSSVDAILDTIRMEDCDLALLSWKGYSQTKGRILSSTIDRILRESSCDLVVHKNFRSPRRMILAVNPKAKNPMLKDMGRIFLALARHYRAETMLVCVHGSEMPVYFKPEPGPALNALGMTYKDFNRIKFVSADSITKAIIEQATVWPADLVMVGSAKPKPLKDIRFGRIPEALAKHLPDGVSLIIFRGHRGIGKALVDRVKSWFA